MVMLGQSAVRDGERGQMGGERAVLCLPYDGWGPNTPHGDEDGPQFFRPA